MLEAGCPRTPALGMTMMIRLGRLQGKEEDTELLLADLHLTVLHQVSLCLTPSLTQSLPRHLMGVSLSR